MSLYNLAIFLIWNGVDILGDKGNKQVQEKGSRQVEGSKQVLKEMSGRQKKERKKEEHGCFVNFS